MSKAQKSLDADSFRTLTPLKPRPIEPQTLSDMDLLSQSRRGNKRAFGELVNRYQARVASTVIGMLGQGPEADDVGQETFIRFYRALDSFRGDAQIATYLHRIAINLSLNALKKRKRQQNRFSRPEKELLESMPAGPAPVTQFDDAAVVEKALNQLKPDFRSVVVLRLVEGYSTSETAALLNLPQGTVLSRLARAQRKLRTILGPYFEENGYS